MCIPKPAQHRTQPPWGQDGRRLKQHVKASHRPLHALAKERDSAARPHIVRCRKRAPVQCLECKTTHSVQPNLELHPCACKHLLRWCLLLLWRGLLLSLRSFPALAAVLLPLLLRLLSLLLPLLPLPPCCAIPLVRLLWRRRWRKFNHLPWPGLLGRCWRLSSCCLLPRSRRLALLLWLLRRCGSWRSWHFSPQLGLHSGKWYRSCRLLPLVWLLGWCWCYHGLLTLLGLRRRGSWRNCKPLFCQLSRFWSFRNDLRHSSWRLLRSLLLPSTCLLFRCHSLQQAAGSAACGVIFGWGRCQVLQKANEGGHMLFSEVSGTAAVKQKPGVHGDSMSKHQYIRPTTHALAMQPSHARFTGRPQASASACTRLFLQTQAGLTVKALSTSTVTSAGSAAGRYPRHSTCTTMASLAAVQGSRLDAAPRGPRSSMSNRSCTSCLCNGTGARMGQESVW